MSSGSSDRVLRWLNTLPAGKSFTVTDVADGVNASSNPDETPLLRHQVAGSLARLVKYGIGLSRRAQGIYLWTPPSGKPGPRPGPRGPRPRPIPASVTPLAIASDSSEGAVVVDPQPAPVAAEPTPPAFTSTFTYAPPSAPDNPQDKRLNGNGSLNPGEPVLLTVLAPLDGGGFIGQGDADGRVYSVKPVD